MTVDELREQQERERKTSAQRFEDQRAKENVQAKDWKRNR